MRKNERQSPIKICFISLISSLAILYLSAYLFHMDILPFELMETLVIASLFLGTSIGQIIMLKKCETGVLKTAILSATIEVLIILLATLAVDSSDIFGGIFIKICLSIYSGAVFASAFTLRPKKNKRFKKKKRR